MIEIRPATPDDLNAFYGHPPPVTVRALVALKDGEIKCIAGVTLEKGQSIAFSDMRENDAGKKERFKIALAMTEWMKQFKPDVTLEPHQMSSDKFLRKLGFRHLGEKNNINVYRL